MKPGHAANIAIVLAVAAWPLMAYGLLSQLGDPAPWVPRADIARQHQIANLVFVLGFGSFAVSLWLSGYAFSAARKRSLAALLLHIVGLASFYWMVFL